MGFVSY